MAENKFIPGVFAKIGKNPAFINIGIKLEDFVTITLNAMKEIASSIGL